MAGVDIELGLRDGSVGSVDELGAARLGETSEYCVQRKGSFLSVQYRMWRVTSIPVSFIKSRELCHYSFIGIAEKELVTNRHHQDPVSPHLEADLTGQDEFLKVILLQDNASLSPAEAKSLPACVAWYGKYLECRFNSAWTTLVKQTLEGVSNSRIAARPKDINLIYNFISIVAKLLLEVKGLAMVEIVDELANLHLLKDQKDGERAIPNQLVFAAVGWLSKPSKFYRV